MKTREWKMDREWRLPTRTIGRLYDVTTGIEEFLVYVGEDVVRQKPGEPWNPACKVPHETAIPSGRYRLKLTFSARFKRILPLVCDVPSFEGIRFHGAKQHLPVEASTEGCLCVGSSHDAWGVYDCHPALEDIVIARLEKAEKAHEEVWLTVP